jgi:hypothetical protein
MKIAMSGNWIWKQTAVACLKTFLEMQRKFVNLSEYAAPELGFELDTSLVPLHEVVRGNAAFKSLKHSRESFHFTLRVYLLVSYHSHDKPIIPLNSINQSTFVMVKCCVFFDVRTYFLNLYLHELQSVMWLTLLLREKAAFWALVPCSLVVDRCFRGASTLMRVDGAIPQKAVIFTLTVRT